MLTRFHGNIVFAIIELNAGKGKLENSKRQHNIESLHAECLL